MEANWLGGRICGSKWIPLHTTDRELAARALKKDVSKNESVWLLTPEPGFDTQGAMLGGQPENQVFLPRVRSALYRRPREKQIPITKLLFSGEHVERAT